MARSAPTGKRYYFVQAIQCLSRENDILFEWYSPDLDESAADGVQAALEIALDTIEEKIGGGHGPTLERAKGDPYLGLLATADGTRVYGRAGSTRTVLVAAKDANIDAKLMRDCTDAIHVAYVEALCNPFLSSGGVMLAPPLATGSPSPADPSRSTGGDGSATGIEGSKLLRQRIAAIAALTAPGSSLSGGRAVGSNGSSGPGSPGPRARGR